MDRRRQWFVVLVSCLLPLVCGGATCNRFAGGTLPPPPPVLVDDAPSLTDVAAAVNRSRLVDQLSTGAMRVRLTSAPQLPELRGTMSARRDRDFRLRAKLPVMLGSAIDLGSNATSFWIQAPGPTGRRTLYHADHEIFRRSMRRDLLPVDPTWVMDALGLAAIDPNAVVAGPHRREDGLIEVRSIVAMPDGNYDRVLYIEPRGGYVTTQIMIDPAGRTIAAAHSTQHVYYPIGDAGVVLPHRVDLQLSPPGGESIAMQIRIDQYAVNQLISSDPRLFEMPTDASETINLTVPTGVPTHAATTQPSSYRVTQSQSPAIRTR